MLDKSSVEVEVAELMAQKGLPRKNALELLLDLSILNADVWGTSAGEHRAKADYHRELAGDAAERAILASRKATTVEAIMRDDAAKAAAADPTPRRDRPTPPG